jgi:hypothetical protein
MFMKASLVIGGALIASGAAWAGSQIESRISTCGSINCAGESIRGTHELTEPFVTQIFARAGECLRLDVTQESADTALRVVGPSVNFTAGNNNREAGDTRPLLRLDDLASTGWYTVLVSLQGAGNTVVRFRLDYGRYQGGNVNCTEIAATSAADGDAANGVASPVEAGQDDSAE